MNTVAVRQTTWRQRLCGDYLSFTLDTMVAAPLVALGIDSGAGGDAITKNGA